MPIQHRLPGNPVRHPYKPRKTVQSPSTVRTYAFWGKRMEAGGCPTCSTGVPMPELAHLKWPLCEKCWFARIARTRLGSGSHGPIIKKKLEEQNYRCAYSGLRLVPGLNANLDHILPKHLHPELASDPSNVEWVDAHVNLMKWSMTPEDLRDFLLHILDHRWGLKVR